MGSARAAPTFSLRPSVLWLCHDIGKCARGFQAKVLGLWPSALGPRPKENSVASVRHGLLARLEALEALVKPKGRVFVFVDLSGDPATYEEREAAFRAENGVGPEDEMHIVHITYD